MSRWHTARRCPLSAMSDVSIVWYIREMMTRPCAHQKNRIGVKSTTHLAGSDPPQHGINASKNHAEPGGIHAAPSVATAPRGCGSRVGRRHSMLDDDDVYSGSSARRRSTSDSPTHRRVDWMCQAHAHGHAVDAHEHQSTVRHATNEVQQRLAVRVRLTSGQ